MCFEPKKWKDLEALNDSLLMRSSDWGVVSRTAYFRNACLQIPIVPLKTLLNA